MNKVEMTALINSIKSNDLVLFSKFIKNNENVCFGRFPVLSLCYMYNAKKIIKAYRDVLIKVKYYNVVDEPLEFYHKFKSIAGRSLRLYLDDNQVSPIEMLAILNKDSEVKKMFKECADKKLLSEKPLKNLTKIYTINKQKTKTKKNKISIESKKLTKKEKLLYRIGLASSFAVILVICSVLTLLNSTIGFGTSSNPYKIYNSTQLLHALKADGHYILCKDLEIAEELDDITFKGNLDGNDHTLTINYLPSKRLIMQNNGLIKNLKIEYGSHDAIAYENISLLTSTNNGTINNVDISCENISLTCNKSSNDIYVNAYANTNNGTIENCDLQINLSISSTGSGECYASGFAGINSGTIDSCTFTEGSINTSEADVSGICITNELGATIENTKNHASISQISTLNSWSPNVSGFSMNNYGTIQHCINYGNISATSNNEAENAEGNILIGGICSNNFGLIQKSLNKGNLTATAKKIVIYAGGISAYSSYWVKDNTQIIPSILRCGTQGKINLTSEDEKGMVFAGGISGFLWGEVQNSYSILTFNNAHDGEKFFIGSLLGSAYLEYGFYSSYIRIDALNNYVLEHDNTTYHIGSLINNGSLVSAGTNISNDTTTGVTVANEDTIKQKEVYFNE